MSLLQYKRYEHSTSDQILAIKQTVFCQPSFQSSTESTAAEVKAFRACVCLVPAQRLRHTVTQVPERQ